MSHLTDLTASHFIEGTTPQIDYTLKDEDGNIITTTLLTQLATIYDEDSKAVLTGWDAEDIKALQGNLVTSGIGVWTLPTSATALIRNAESEIHIILMEFTYDVNKTGKHMFRVKVIKEDA